MYFFLLFSETLVMCGPAVGQSSTLPAIRLSLACLIHCVNRLYIEHDHIWSVSYQTETPVIVFEGKHGFIASNIAHTSAVLKFFIVIWEF